MPIRYCANPACKAPINQAFGMTNAGDYNEFLEGRRKIEDVRELCGRCALPTSMMKTQAEIAAYFVTVGFSNDSQSDASPGV